MLRPCGPMSSFHEQGNASPMEIDFDLCAGSTQYCAHSSPHKSAQVKVTCSHAHAVAEASLWCSCCMRCLSLRALAVIRHCDACKLKASLATATGQRPRVRTTWLKLYTSGSVRACVTLYSQCTFVHSEHMSKEGVPHSLGLPCTQACSVPRLSVTMCILQHYEQLNVGCPVKYAAGRQLQCPASCCSRLTQYQQQQQ